MDKVSKYELFALCLLFFKNKWKMESEYYDSTIRI